MKRFANVIILWLAILLQDTAISLLIIVGFIFFKGSRHWSVYNSNLQSVLFMQVCLNYC